MATLNTLSIASAAPLHRHSPQRHRLRTPSTLLTGQGRLAGVRDWHVGSKVRVALGDGAREGADEVWCGLCGDRGGWLMCGRCMGEGGFPTRPGLAGVKGKVGWGRCKTCFGRKVVPCLFCGVSDVAEWKLWVENAKRHPHRSRKQVDVP
ncbi:hypothetical protein KC19_4G088600 [Ceratodon purpureus]|uniref:Uncharacterized protein n=1 Tax=Ceratodon purpureus TaxID=3225 RepID=A0A8T0I707_CERPU|nr:hypothetical protein KC19_4G088600 [Ceratodon purpureus]